MSIPLDSLACQVTSTGISRPSYADIYGTLQLQFQSIYGSDAVIDPDSQDGQMLAIFAQGMDDANASMVFVYNQFSPATSQGVGLSSVVKINGLAREASTNSTAILTIVGQAGTTITDGLVGDAAGNQWALPASVVIPGGGSIAETATCTTSGAINADANTINQILNPTRGWQSATNPAGATPGAPVETDAELRQRQSTSTSIPSSSNTSSTIGNVANLPGVQKSKIYENPTGIIDTNTLPAHSISVVVSGGDAVEIAQTIANTKAPGCYTYGTTSEIVLDPSGNPELINFFNLSLVTVTVTIGLRALTNYVSTTGTLIAEVVAAFISQLGIGEVCYVNRLFGPASLDGDVAVSTSGLTQLQLDALSATFMVGSIVISRSPNIPDTTATNGPYNMGAVSITVAKSSDFYIGCPISITLDNATSLVTTITMIDPSTNTLTFGNAVAAGRQILNGANVFMTADVNIAFNEDAVSVAANVTVNAT